MRALVLASKAAFAWNHLNPGHPAAQEFNARGSVSSVQQGCVKLLILSLASIGWRRGPGGGGPFLLASPLHKQERGQSCPPRRYHRGRSGRNLLLPLVSVALLLTAAAGALGADKQLILIAGRPSHPPGMHEFRAGCLLLQKCLATVPGLQTTVFTNGWPAEDALLAQADAIVIYSDGGGGHPAIQGEHLKVLDALIAKGIGFGVMHYACEIPANKGGKELQDWVGGYYEDKLSCNPIWKPDFQKFPDHPIARGVQPFTVEDEWYFNMRFRDDPKGVIGVLVAKPSDKVRDGPYVWPAGPYPHIQAAKGREELMMWAVERPGGGRGFGFTGGHFHRNWGDENFRKVVLNALLWAARVDVPPGGLASGIAPSDLEQNLDPKKK